MEESIKNAVLKYTRDKIIEKLRLRQQGQRTVKWDDHAHNKLRLIGRTSKEILAAMPDGEIIEIHWEHGFDMVKVIVYLQSMTEPIHVVLLMADEYFKVKTVYTVDDVKYFIDKKTRIR